MQCALYRRYSFNNGKLLKYYRGKLLGKLIHQIRRELTRISQNPYPTQHKRENRTAQQQRAKEKSTCLSLIVSKRRHDRLSHSLSA